MKRIGIFLWKSIVFFFLTVLTQVGGLVYLLSFLVAKKWQKVFKGKFVLVFLALYLLVTFGIVPFIAPLFGREQVKHSKMIRPTNYMTVFLNRNYVRPALNKVLQDTESQLLAANSIIQIRYLDACFPFVDKFPLLPHLSHNDGKKIDISLVYETSDGTITNKKKSRSGYGAFEHPTKREFNQTEKCKSAGYFQYDFPKYLTLGRVHRDLVFSKQGNLLLMNSILKNRKVGKIFIEPHLKSRLRLSDNRIRFHGCQAVRHDDHIHVQLK